MSSLAIKKSSSIVKRRKPLIIVLVEHILAYEDSFAIVKCFKMLNCTNSIDFKCLDDKNIY